MVSDTLSPLDAEEEAASEKPMTLPPRRVMADSKLSLVRVLGVFGGLLLNIVCQSKQLVQFLNREVKWVHQVSHFMVSSFLRRFMDNRTTLPYHSALYGNADAGNPHPGQKKVEEEKLFDF